MNINTDLYKKAKQIVLLNNNYSINFHKYQANQLCVLNDNNLKVNDIEIVKLWCEFMNRAFQQRYLENFLSDNNFEYLV